MNDEENENKKELTQVTWLEEISDQRFDDDVFGACSTNSFSLSNYLGNDGRMCTLTHECMNWCK